MAWKHIAQCTQSYNQNPTPLYAMVDSLGEVLVEAVTRIHPGIREYIVQSIGSKGSFLEGTVWPVYMIRSGSSHWWVL